MNWTKIELDQNRTGPKSIFGPKKYFLFNQSELEYVVLEEIAILQKKLFWKNNALFLYNQILIFKILIGKLNYMDTLVLPLNKID